MPFDQLTKRKAPLFLFTFLLLEVALVLSLRSLGWYGTGSAIQVIACVAVTLLPLVVALAILLRRRLQFGLRALFIATALVAFFLAASLIPLVNYRLERQAATRLLSASATISAVLNFDEFYSRIGLDPARNIVPKKSSSIPPWLTPFTQATSSVPADNAIRSVWLTNDNQCQILADNWESFPSLQSVGVGRGVSVEGFRLLQTVLPRFEHLDRVETNDVLAPPKWYASLTNIRTLWIWGEGASRGKPFPREHLDDIVSLSNLEVLMVLGYAFNDADARELATSSSIRRVILRGTAVTPAGESDLANDTLGRVVYRD
jgi:hypothetical protein